jgi:hypothetical protein
MIQADQTQFVCANEQYYLLRDNDPVTWPTANGKNFWASSQPSGATGAEPFRSDRSGR